MILVSGGAGVMGARLVRRLVEMGWEVRALVLPHDPLVSRLDGVGCDICYGDVSDKASLHDAFAGVETVYHLAAIIIARDPGLFDKINVQGTRNMVECAAAAGAKHFVLVSSISVVYPQTTPYSLSKRVSESIVRTQNSMRYTIVRPTLAYEENGGQEFMMFMDYLKKYPIVPFIGTGRAIKNPVHVNDIIQGLANIAGNKRAFDKVYNFSGGEEMRIWDLAHLMLAHEGMRKPFVPIPVFLCKLLAALLGLLMQNPPLTWNAIAGIIQDANPDHSPATQDLGYRPIGVREGLPPSRPVA